MKYLEFIDYWLNRGADTGMIQRLRRLRESWVERLPEQLGGSTGLDRGDSIIVPAELTDSTES